MRIEDLSVELDSKTLSTVRGGDNGSSAASTILQQMGIQAPIGVEYGTGSAGNTFINIGGSQSAGVSNHQTSGDKYAAWLGTLQGL